MAEIEQTNSEDTQDQVEEFVAVAAEPEDGAAVTVDADADDDDEELVESEDSLTYSNGVMKGNLMHFVQEQFGAENLTKGVSVEVTDDNRVVVNISVIIEYGAYAPDIFEEVKERVTERLGAMTGLEVAGINLRIEDVLTPEEYEGSEE